jgi:GNAT superfamily N-acetyltransferase
MTTVVRAATRDDVPSLTALAAASVRELQRDDYPPELLERAIREVYGVDTTLIEDGTYFVIEGADGIVACGGWSKRKTLCGGDHWTQRDDEFLDPAVDAAKIRAFYVRPDRARRGLGTMLLEACEAAAQAAGFHRFEMAATLTGVRLYERRGYVAIDRSVLPLPGGDGLTVVRMTKET